jgi:hypothetical protein
VTELILGALIAVVAVVIVALPFLRDTGEPELIDDSTSEAILELIEARDRALAALKELEFDHRTGKVDDADYRASVGPLRREAAQALQALDKATGGRSAEENLREQEEIQTDDDDGDERGADRGDPPVDEGTHHVTARREPDEGDQRERDPEREHDLRDHERS